MKMDLEKLEDLYYSNIEHVEDQPCHLKIKNTQKCIEECLPRFGAPCLKFCPAQLYELSEDKNEIKLQSANCLHCKTCQIKDAFQNIEWTFPESGSGAGYRNM